MSVVATPICVAAAITPKPKVAPYASTPMVFAFGIVGWSAAVTRFRASEASHEKTARMTTATIRFGMNART